MTYRIQKDSLHHKIIISEEFLGNKLSPCIFLDRDGVIIEDRHYLKDPNNVQLTKGAADWMRKAYHMGWKLVIVTNQSGISRGLFTWEDYEMISYKMLNLLGLPSPIMAIYANGYGPNVIKSTWRKPNPDMLINAANDLHLDLSQSILIGDRLNDLIAGARASIPLVFHVMSGHGSKERVDITSRITSDNKFVVEKHMPTICLHESLADCLLHHCPQS